MKPILFNTENVISLLEGRKTVTRRAVKPQPPATAHVSKARSDYGWSFWEDNPEKHYMKPPYQPGDILWVRETWAEMPYGFVYRADGEEPDGWDCDDRWRPSIHMPRAAARIFLRVTGVHVERLQAVNYFGCLNEGIPYRQMEADIVQDFAALWDRTIKPKDRPTYGWEANPWVWVIEFERISGEMEAGKE